MRVDLHTHTNFSDGILDPEALVTLAHNRGVGLLSITDHDCLDAIPRAEAKARELGMILVPGVELNTDWGGGEVHILGYGFAPQDSRLQEKLREQREFRLTRLRAMVEKLNGIGCRLNERRVREIAGEGSAGRPHLAMALMEKGYVVSIEEAFRKYLGYGKPGWVPRSRFTPEEAVTAVAQAGGLPVLAHPGRAGNFSLDDLVRWGLRGIEVFYPTHPPELMRKLLNETERRGLVATAGSDYHGINPGEKEPGGVDVPEEVASRLRRIFKKGEEE